MPKKEEKIDNLIRITVFDPAFDKRNKEPEKNYGIGSVISRMILKGKKGAVQFVFSTGILFPETIEEYIKTGLAKYELTSCGYYFLNKPSAYDIGYHSKKKQYKEQTISKEKCEFCDDKPCYYDGSGLGADKYLDILIRKGSDAVWEELEKYYREIFN